MPSDAQQIEIDANLEYFLKELPSLAAQRGKFAVLRHRVIVDFFDTPLEAVKAAAALYPDKIFSVQQVTEASTDLGFYSHADNLGATQ